MRSFLIATVLALLAAVPFTATSLAQECTGPDCATPGGHECERERKEAPTA